MTNMSPEATLYTSLLSLPTELLENIILLSTIPPEFGSRSIVALAQTCQLLRSLIYNTPDSHLWREVFLASFDDPRELETQFGFPDDTVHDWEAAYKDRTGCPGEHALISTTLDSPPIPRYSYEHVDGIVPLPRPQIMPSSANSKWIDSLLKRPSFADVYRESPRIQWLYGPRYRKDNDRLLAKGTVYDMRYLTPNRCWGPWMPIVPEEEVPVESSSSIRGIYNIQLIPSLLNEADSESDPDYVDSETGSNAADDEGGEDNGAVTIPNIHLYPLVFPPSIVPTPPTIFPSLPHTLVPDYTWLAAARLLIEENIKEHAYVVFPEPDNERDFLQELLDLRGLEVLRLGGAPGYWDGATKWGAQTEESSKGKSKEEGWDWAGVEGEYRRIVCWMDYRELLLHNLRGPSRSSRETTRVFPLSLRVSGYSAPPEAPENIDQLTASQRLAYTLSVIEVEGESTGSDVDAHADRRVWGTVRMVGDGTVRWTLTSAEPNTDDPEWITESIQIGRPGSAMGFMGLWTGVEHTKTDPVGPCWAWKVN